MILTKQLTDRSLCFGPASIPRISLANDYATNHKRVDDTAHQVIRTRQMICGSDAKFSSMALYFTCARAAGEKHGLAVHYGAKNLALLLGQVGSETVFGFWCDDHLFSLLE
jgi:hypothetical protein